MIRSIARVLASLSLALAAACSGAVAPAPPGYSGPIASTDARDLLAQLQGEVLDDAAGELGGGAFTVGAFGVVPNPATGKGPVVQLEGPGGVVWLPMQTDGDVADLWRRVRGAVPDGLTGPTSDAYRAVWRAGGE